MSGARSLRAQAPRRTQAQTLVEVLDWHVSAHAGKLHIHLYGEGDSRRRPHLSRSEAGRAEGGGRPRPARARAGPGSRYHAPDGQGVSVQLLRDPDRRRHPGADLPAGPAVADRGSSAAPRRHSGEQPGALADHGARGEAAFAPAARTIRFAAWGDDGRRARGDFSGPSSTQRARGRTWRSSSTHRAAREARKALR